MCGRPKVLRSCSQQAGLSPWESSEDRRTATLREQRGTLSHALTANLVARRPTDVAAWGSDAKGGVIHCHYRCDASESIQHHMRSGGTTLRNVGVEDKLEP